MDGRAAGINVQISCLISRQGIPVVELQKPLVQAACIAETPSRRVSAVVATSVVYDVAEVLDRAGHVVAKFPKPLLAGLKPSK